MLLQTPDDMCILVATDNQRRDTTIRQRWADCKLLISTIQIDDVPVAGSACLMRVRGAATRRYMFVNLLIVPIVIAWFIKESYALVRNFGSEVLVKFGKKAHSGSLITRGDGFHSCGKR